VASKYYKLGGKDSYGCLQYMDERQVVGWTHDGWYLSGSGSFLLHGAPHSYTEPYIDPTPYGITHATNVRDKNVFGSRRAVESQVNIDLKPNEISYKSRHDYVVHYDIKPN
jgi:hypothetical protein